MFTEDDIELLNRRAKNDSKLHFEGGIDYDSWRFYPSRTANQPGDFTDGHDHGMYGPSGVPYDGWELTEPVVLPPEAVATLLHELHELRYAVRDVARPKRGADREAKAFETNRRIEALFELFRDCRDKEG